jgi:hypothetical protein
MKLSSAASCVFSPFFRGALRNERSKIDASLSCLFSNFVEIMQIGFGLGFSSRQMGIEEGRRRLDFQKSLALTYNFRH